MTRRPAYTLVHMLIVIALVATVMAAAGHALHLSVRSSTVVANDHNAMMRTQRVLLLLRQDAWSSPTLEMISPAQLVMKDAQGAPIVWRIERTALTRKEGDRRPVTLGTFSWTFEQRGSAVRVIDNKTPLAILVSSHVHLSGGSR